MTSLSIQSPLSVCKKKAAVRKAFFGDSLSRLKIKLKIELLSKNQDTLAIFDLNEMFFSVKLSNYIAFTIRTSHDVVEPIKKRQKDTVLF